MVIVYDYDTRSSKTFSRYAVIEMFEIEDPSYSMHFRLSNNSGTVYTGCYGKGVFFPRISLFCRLSLVSTDLRLAVHKLASQAS